VVVGDPLQLEPVITLPWGGQRALLAAFKLDPEWAPARTSVQRLADRQTARGTYLQGDAAGADAGSGVDGNVADGSGAHRVWVGSPLRVHRRCDHPMLDISNEIAYGGLMVDGVPDDREPFPGGNYWYDVQSAVAEGNWITAEGERLGWLLEQLRERGVPAAKIRVISPFRKVAERAADIHREVFAEVGKENREKWVGTVHTMQGKEADVVILILGGNPARPRARTFATSKPNLLNVAVTRARRRLYVIGNHATWGNAPYFRVLARHTEVWPPVEYRESLPGKP
jgi:superfamily I DNA and/or RNA helicase